MAVQLRCLDKDHKGEAWTLDLGAPGVILRDMTGGPVAEFTPEEAAKRFQMPSFSESIKYFGIVIDGKVQRFDVPRAGLKEIRAFTYRVTLASGPEAVRAVQRRAIRDTLIGAVRVVAGIALTIGAYLAAANKLRDGRYSVFYGLVLFGLVMLGRGIYRFRQYRELQRIHSGTEGGAPTP